MKILLLGKNGMLGSDICASVASASSARSEYLIHLTALGKDELDITDKTAVYKKVNSVKPDILINCAAYTDVDGCEKNKDLAFKVNGYSLDYISKACKKNNCKLIHFSTDYVFDGTKEEGYNEDDKPNPINIYGESKLMAEKFILENMGENGNFAIIRISFLFGKNGENFVKKIIRAAEEKLQNGENLIKVVDTQVSCPTYTVDLAKRIFDFFNNDLRGIFHLTNSGALSKYECAKEIIKLKGLNIKVIPCDESEFQLPAKRPNFSILKNLKLRQMDDYSKALIKFLS